MRVRRASVQVCALVPTALQRHWFYLGSLPTEYCHPTRGYEYNDSGSNSSTTGSAWNDSAGGGSGRRREERKEEAEKVKDRLPNYEAEADEKTDRRIRPELLAADVDSDGAVVSRPKDNGPPPSTSSSDPNSHIPPLLILMEPAQQAQVGSILLFWWPGEQTLEPVPVS
ncbi:hypothetical protein BDP67DRAFT_561276 [Colletotrichum lupini]|nr:hypothetical protein BDP67DRAFT_561276 [Colletotrichum lupini]